MVREEKLNPTPEDNELLRFINLRWSIWRMRISMIRRKFKSGLTSKKAKTQNTEPLITYNLFVVVFL